MTEDSTAQNDQPENQGAPLFYTLPEPLALAEHKDVKIRAEQDFSFAGGTNTIPITAPEFSMAARHYPIIYIGDSLVPAIAVGLVAGKNLFVKEDGTWEDGFYIPAYVRRYPFILLGKETDERLPLGIDNNGKSEQQDARPLFNDDGEESEVVKNALSLCEQFHQAYLYTAEMAKEIGDAGIIEDRSIEIELKSGKTANLGSFKAVNEEKIRGLSNEKFIEWREKGFLPGLYFHLQSLTTWQNLISRAAALGETFDGQALATTQGTDSAGA